MKNPLFVLMITVSAILLCPVMVFAFHINPASDALTSEQAQSYVEKPVSTVTGALGAPSMVRKNVTDANSIDYIFIGNNKIVFVKNKYSFFCCFNHFKTIITKNI